MLLVTTINQLQTNGNNSDLQFQKSKRRGLANPLHERGVILYISQSHKEPCKIRSVKRGPSLPNTILKARLENLRKSNGLLECKKTIYLRRESKNMRKEESSRFAKEKVKDK